MRLVDLTTKPWQLMLPGEKETSLNKMVYLPGPLDEFGVGHEDRLDNSCHPDETTAQSFDDDVIATRFTRKHTYEGPAYFEQEITIAPADKCRTFFEIERARCVRVYLDGEEISSYEEQTIITPHVFELTGHEGIHRLRVESDNSYPGLPHDAIVYSSAATDETQTNWNGLLGYIRLREENPIFLSQVRMYPKDGGKLRAEIDLDTYDEPFEGVLVLKSSVLLQDYEQKISVMTSNSRKTIVAEDLLISSSAANWDEYDGKLYELTAALYENDLQSSESEINQKEYVPEIQEYIQTTDLPVVTIKVDRCSYTECNKAYGVPVYQLDFTYSSHKVDDYYESAIDSKRGAKDLFYKMLEVNANKNYYENESKIFWDGNLLNQKEEWCYSKKMIDL